MDLLTLVHRFLWGPENVILAGPFAAFVPAIISAVASIAGSAISANAQRHSGGGGGGGTMASATPGAASSVAPGTTPDAFKQNQQAYYQNLLASLGQGTEGGALPGNIQENIDRQAALIK